MNDDLAPEGRPFPDWDINRKQGEQAALWVVDIRKALAGGATVEVKAPKPFLKTGSFYLETWCCKRGKWEKSGINTTKADLWFFTFGPLPCGWVIETQWLKRAAKLAYERGLIDECTRGRYPTKAVIVSMKELYATRDKNLLP